MATTLWDVRRRRLAEYNAKQAEKRAERAKEVPPCAHCGNAGTRNERDEPVAWCGHPACYRPNEVEV